MLRRTLLPALLTCCVLTTAAFAQQPQGAYAPPPGNGGGVIPANYTGLPMAPAARPVSATMPADAEIPKDIFERAASWRPNEAMDSRYAPTFYKRAAPSHLPPASMLNQPGFVPEVRTRGTWRDGLTKFLSLPFIGN